MSESTPKRMRYLAVLLAGKSALIPGFAREPAKHEEPDGKPFSSGLLIPPNLAFLDRVERLSTAKSISQSSLKPSLSGMIISLNETRWIPSTMLYMTPIPWNAPHILMSVIIYRKSRYTFLMKRALPASPSRGNWYCPRLFKTPSKVRSRTWRTWKTWVV